jgi:internalin A
MRARRFVHLASLTFGLLALAGCGAPTPAPQPIDDPPAIAQPKITPPPAVVLPPKDKELVPPPPPAVPVTPADKARLNAAEKAGATVYEAQNGGYEVRIEPTSDAAAILAGLKSTKCVVALSVEGEKLTDDALNHLDGFDHLERLTLHRCPNVNGTGFAGLPKLPRLKSLAVSECPLTDVACPPIGRTGSLEEVRLIRTKVTDDGLRQLAGLAAMETLGLEGTQVTGAGFAGPGWAKLREIEAPNAALSDAGLEAVGKLPALAVLRVDSCNVTDAGLHHLRNTKTLAELSLAGTKVTDRGLASLKGLDKLRALDVSKTAVQGSALAELPAAAMRKLVLDSTRFDDTGAKHLARFTGLTTLSASDCPVTDAGLIGLKELKKLTKVNLSGTKAADGVAKLLGTLPELEVATLDRTGLTDAGLRELVRAPRLRFVEARGTKVTKRGVIDATKFGPPGLRVDAE